VSLSPFSRGGMVKLEAIALWGVIVFFSRGLVEILEE